MGDISDRLRRGAAILDLLDLKRATNTMTPDDYDREYIILATELWDLEEEILLNPEGLEPQRVPARRRTRPRR